MNYEKPDIVCVLRSGGDYLPSHVARLDEMIAHYVRGPYDFTCLTDVPDTIRPGINTRELRHMWPGWWSKLELFREFPHGAFYLDLDTTITGDITRMIQPTEGFWALRDFGSPQGSPRMGSGVMHWGRGFRRIYEVFSENPERLAMQYRTPAQWGDQAFIPVAMLPEQPRFLQDLYPGQIRSYKWGVLPHGLTPDTRIVCFHGKPRPWDAGHFIKGF